MHSVTELNCSLMILIILLCIQWGMLCVSFPYCPVSYLKNDNIRDNNFTYRYPNLYFVNQTFTEENSYNCAFAITYPGYVSPSIRCTIDYMCPIHQVNVMTAMNKQKWIASTKTFDKIVSVEQAVRHNQSIGDLPLINVIVLGGSMTAGHDINCGCICTHELDHRCNSTLTGKCTIKPEPCKWEMHFSGWLKKYYGQYINFHTINFAKGGVDSSFHASFLSDWIYDRGIQLTENDLFILDSSCNDAGIFNVIAMKVGVEALIRRIQYIMAQALNQPTIRPTIVILEQFPFASNYPLPGHDVFPTSAFKDRDYALIYESLAKHYNLMLWSIRDVYSSYYDENIDVSQRYPINPISDKRGNPMHHYPHIPWFGNLYMADLMAACFLQSMKNSEAETKVESSQLTSVYPPHELYSHSSISKSYCNESKPFLIHNVSSTTFHPTNLTEYESIPNVGWREYIDYHDAPGYIIDKYSDPQQRSLAFKFEFNIPAKARFDVLKWWNSYILKIVFLKSYQSMGAAKVFICGREATKAYLDGLHSDYRHYKVSGPEFVFIDQLSDYCNPDLVSIAEVVVQYEYPDKPPAEIRGIGKFKLMSIELCST